jgi:hypothetical protein
LIFLEANIYQVYLLENAVDLLVKYFIYHAQAITNMQKVVDLVIVNVSGRSLLVEAKTPVSLRNRSFLLLRSL